MCDEADKVKARQECTIFQEEQIKYDRLILPSLPMFNIEKHNRPVSANMTNIFHHPESTSQTVTDSNMVSKFPASKLNLTNNPPQRRLLII